MAQSVDRETICRHYINSLRSGEHAAAEKLAPHIAPDAVSRFNEDTYYGRDQVLFRATGKWPTTQYTRKGGWSEPAADGDRLVVIAEYPPYITQRRVKKVTFAFNDRDEIREVIHEVERLPPRLTAGEVPLAVRGIVNDAVPNGTPMSVAHVGEDGAPVLTVRGSVQFFGPAQLSVWLRNPKGGLATAIARDPRVALLYRDSARVVTVSITGLAHVETDEAVRERVYEAMSEFEQTHDPDREGACMIVDIKDLKCQVASQTTTVRLLVGGVHPEQAGGLCPVIVQPVEDGRVADEAGEQPDRVHAEQAAVAGHHGHVAAACHGDHGRDVRDVRSAGPPRQQPGAEPSDDEAEQDRANVRHDDHAHSCPTISGWQNRRNVTKFLKPASACAARKRAAGSEGPGNSLRG